VDIPLFWDYVGQVLGYVFLSISNSERKSFLMNSVLKKQVSEEAGLKLVTNLLISAVKNANFGVPEVFEAWESAELSWSDMLPCDQNEIFLKLSKLDFPMAQFKTFTDTLKTFSSSTGDFIIKLTEKSRSDTNADLEGLIKRNFTDNQLIASLRSSFFKAVVRGCIDTCKGDSDVANYVLNKDKLKQRIPLLGTLIQESGDAERMELLCLYELQDLADELSHPNKLLGAIFDTLYNDVISMETYAVWKQSSDRSKGKVMALMSTKSFFDWLENSSSEESS